MKTSKGSHALIRYDRLLLLSLWIFLSACSLSGSASSDLDKSSDPKSETPSAGGSYVAPASPMLQLTPPTAQDPGSYPLSGPAPLTVHFFGEGSDPDGGSVSFSWTFGDGASAAEQSPIHTYSSPGTYTSVVTVMDDEGASSTASATIQVFDSVAAGVPPTAQGWVGTLFGASPFVVQLRGYGEDPDGGAVTYDWDLDSNGSYEIAGLQTPTVTFMPGAHLVTLRTTDNEGLTALSTLTIYVCEEVFPSLGPAVQIETDTLNPAAGESVKFYGTAADMDGESVSFAWDFEGDGVVDSAERNPSFAYSDAGIYQVLLTVRDDEGESSQASIVMIVGSSGQPAAMATAEGLTGSPDFPVQFHAGTNIEDAVFSWDFDGDGVTDSVSPTESDPIFTYTSLGLYPATLTVTDPATGLASESVLWIAVGLCSEMNPPPQEPPPDIPLNDFHIVPGPITPPCDCLTNATIGSDGGASGPGIPPGTPSRSGIPTEAWFVMHGTGYNWDAPPAVPGPLCPGGVPVSARRQHGAGGEEDDPFGLPTPVPLGVDLTLPVHFDPANAIPSFFHIFTIRYKHTGTAAGTITWTKNGVPVVSAPFLDQVIRYKTCNLAVGHTWHPFGQ